MRLIDKITSAVRSALRKKKARTPKKARHHSLARSGAQAAADEAYLKACREQRGKTFPPGHKYGNSSGWRARG